VHGFELPAKPWLPGHRGIDLAGTPGQPVLAATAGTITYAGPLAGRGVVTVSTGPRRTTYEPVVPALAVGAAVTPGTLIGHLSAAGSHCRPATCLHWGLVQGKQYLNPLTLVPNRPVRLLPLGADPQHQAAAASAPQPSLRTERINSPPGSSPAGERTAAAIVGTTAALTLAAGLLIRRR
jgi:murein DD-endopeptidase MepM/ murein hydrolase activator NlpD